MPRITITTNILVIILTILLEGITLALSGNLIPPKYTPLAVFAIAFVPKVLSVLAHYSNPNGTPAALPYPAARDVAASEGKQ